MLEFCLVCIFLGLRVSSLAQVVPRTLPAMFSLIVGEAFACCLRLVDHGWSGGSDYSRKTTLTMDTLTLMHLTPF